MNILRLENHRLLYILTSLLRRGIHFCSHLEWRLRSQVLVCLFLCFFTFIMCPDSRHGSLLSSGGWEWGVCLQSSKWLKQTPSVSKMACGASLSRRSCLDSTGTTEHWMFVYIYIFNITTYLLLPLLLRLCVSQSAWNIWHLQYFSSTFRANNSPFHKGQKSLLLLTSWTLTLQGSWAVLQKKGWAN